MGTKELLSALETPVMNVNDTVIASLQQHTAWITWTNLWGRIVTEPGGDIAMVRCLKDALSTYDEFDRQVELMSQQVVNEATTDLIELWDERSKAREEKRKMRYGDVDRPETIYRRWMKALRWIRDAHIPIDESSDINWLIREISEEQSLPESELDCPEWIDQMTGEVEEVERIQFQAPEDHEPDFSEAFDSEDGLDEEFFDTCTPKPWMLEDIQKDFQAQNFGFLAHDIFPLTADLRETISETLEATREQHFEALRGAVNKLSAYQKKPYLALKPEIERVFFGKDVTDEVRNQVMQLKLVPEHLKGIFSETRTQVRESPAAEAFLAKCQEYIDNGEFPVDVALVFLSMQHGLCFEEEDARVVRLMEGTNLYDFIEDFEDEILENVNNPSGISTEEPSRDFIEQFCESTIKAYAALGKPSFSKAPDTPQFIEGVIRAASTLRNVKSSALNEAGYDAWRYWMSHDGNEAYHFARSQGADMKEAMVAFWKCANKRPRVASVRDTGLVLTNGRPINWKVAVLKVQHREIELYPADVDRLVGLLEQKPWGSELLAQLRASYSTVPAMSF